MRLFWVLAVALGTSACLPAAITSYNDTYEDTGRPERPYRALRERGGLQGTYLLPRTLFEVTLKKENSERVLEMKKVVEGDPRARLLYRFEPDPRTDDVLEVDTSEDGLLETISSNTTDKTGDIIVKLAELIFTSATRSTSAPTIQALPSKVPTSVEFSASYDPLRPQEVLPVRGRLWQLGYCVLVGREIERGTAACSELPAPTLPVIDPDYEAPLTYASRYPGIYYRRAVPMPVQVFKREQIAAKQEDKDKVKTGAKWGPWTLLFSGNESILDQADIYEISIDRHAFVQTQTKITFTNGTLKKVWLNKPSEALAFYGIPIRVARTIFAIPLAGLQRDASLVEAETKLLNAQVARITAETNLLKLQVQQVGGQVVASPPP